MYFFFNAFKVVVVIVIVIIVVFFIPNGRFDQLRVAMDYDFFSELRNQI